MVGTPSTHRTSECAKVWRPHPADPGAGSASGSAAECALIRLPAGPRILSLWAFPALGWNRRRAASVPSQSGPVEDPGGRQAHWRDSCSSESRLSRNNSANVSSSLPSRVWPAARGQHPCSLPDHHLIPKPCRPGFPERAGQTMERSSKVSGNRKTACGPPGSAAV